MTIDQMINALQYVRKAAGTGDIEVLTPDDYLVDGVELEAQTEAQKREWDAGEVGDHFVRIQCSNYNYK